MNGEGSVEKQAKDEVNEKCNTVTNFDIPSYNKIK